MTPSPVRRLLSACVALCLVAGLVAGAGCAALTPRLEAPQLEVVALTFISGDQQHQQLRLRIHVTNPNARQIAVRSIDYRVALAGADFAAGSSDAPFTVPASGQTDFDLDVATDFGALLRVLSEHLGDPSLEYRVSGRVHLAAGLLRELPFTGHGEFALRAR